MAENKTDTSLFDTNYIKAMVVLSKMMRWWDHKPRVLDLHEKNNNIVYINRLNILIFLRIVLCNNCVRESLILKSLRHTQNEPKNQVIATKYTTTTK